jgi:hypothetical protein
MCRLEPISDFTQDRWNTLHQMEVRISRRNHLEFFTIREEIKAASFEFGAGVALGQLQH